MKTVKKILIVIGILIAIPLFIAIFTKKDYAVEREISINKPKQEVFDYVKQLRNQDNFSVWARIDPNMKKEYRGTDGTVGFVSAWDSENDEVGKGEQEIRNIVQGEKIDFELRFIKPFEGVANANMQTVAASANETKVKWGLSSKMSYPMNFMLLFMDMDKMLGEQLETGLVNLKEIMEK